MRGASILVQALHALGNPAPIGEVFVGDVSEYTGEIDFAQLRPYVSGELQPQIEGMIIRGTDGAKLDLRAARNYEGFVGLGLPVGVYGVHYGRASATANRKQADRLVGLVRTLGEYPKLGVWGDWERDPDKLGIGPMRQAIWKYIGVAEDGLGKPLGAYTNSWWDREVANPQNGATDIPRDRALWAASWYSRRPYIAWDWRQRYGDQCHVLHQYDNRFKFPGVPGSMDASTFNGSRASFYEYFGLGDAPPEEDEMKFRVTVKPFLNVRSGPDIRLTDLGNMYPGTVIELLDIKAGYPSGSIWFRIKGGQYDGLWCAYYLNGTYYLELVG